jgi:hypothetical protein
MLAKNMRYFTTQVSGMLEIRCTYSLDFGDPILASFGARSLDIENQLVLTLVEQDSKRVFATVCVIGHTVYASDLEMQKCHYQR